MVAWNPISPATGFTVETDNNNNKKQTNKQEPSVLLCVEKPRMRPVDSPIGSPHKLSGKRFCVRTESGEGCPSFKLPRTIKKSLIAVRHIWMIWVVVSIWVWVIVCGLLSTNWSPKSVSSWYWLSNTAWSATKIFIRAHWGTGNYWNTHNW